jgi:hypothetical protein
MSSDYSKLFLEINEIPRKEPIEAVKHIVAWFVERGATVKSVQGNSCKFVIYGKFRDKTVDLGIDIMDISELCNEWPELPTKLGNIIEHYVDVGLFICGKIDVQRGNDKYFVTNPKMQGSLFYDTYQSRLQTYTELGINVRQFDNLWQFGPSLDNLLHHLTGFPHTGLTPTRDDRFKLNYSMYQNLPKCGASTAAKMAIHSVGYWISHKEELLKLVKPSKYEKIIEALCNEDMIGR